MRSIRYSAPLAALVAALLAPAAQAQSLNGFGRRAAPPQATSPAPATTQSTPPRIPQRQVTFQSPGGVSNAPVFHQPYSPGSGVSSNQPGAITSRSGPSYPTRREPIDRPTMPVNSGNAPIYNQTGIGIRNSGSSPVFGQRTGYPSVRVTTPVSPSRYYNRGDNYPIYGNPGYDYGNSGYGVTVVGGPVLLGGYYYGNYCDGYTEQNCYPSVYSVYSGFPQYIYNPSVIVLAQPYVPVYVTQYVPFYTPSYPVVYNENIYYVGSQERAREIVSGDDKTRRTALSTAYPEGSFQAAFGDIERAWLDSSVAPLRKHLRDDDVKISVFIKGKYSYSIATSDFLQITRDAFDKLSTVSFKFDRLRKAKNGDVTAYGTHVYRVAGGSGGDGDIVPFSTDGSAPITSDNTSGAAPGVEKTITVSYTLHKQNDQWNIIAIDSTPTDSSK